jgi:uncharacterized Zn-finger protein
MTTAPTAALAAQLAARAGSPDYDRWREQLRGAGYCAHPVRVAGHLRRINPASGQIRSGYDSAAEPDGQLYLACRNRRASVCPTCSATYRADTWQLVAAGLRGGKGIPPSVAEHPRVFATLTAPGFGPVHSQREHNGRSRTCHRATGGCPHGRPTGCLIRHADGDALLGTPLCGDCYDYAGAALWNHYAGELWRRTTIGLHRKLAHATGQTPAGLRRQVRVSFTKVAEYQARGLVHLHAVLRLDAAPQKGRPEMVERPPDGYDARLLIASLRAAAEDAEVILPDVGDGIGRIARWGEQLDVRPITADSEAANPTAVAAYIAKYSTKSTDAIGARLTHRLRADDLPLLDPDRHLDRLALTCWRLGGRPGLSGLRRWAHMLGYGGHYATRSRRYPTTITALRDDRAAHARRNSVVDDTGAPVARWCYRGSGYLTAADAILARTAASGRLHAADEARQQRRAERQLAHEVTDAATAPPEPLQR